MFTAVTMQTSIDAKSAIFLAASVLYDVFFIVCFVLCVLNVFFISCFDDTKMHLQTPLCQIISPA